MKKIKKVALRLACLMFGLATFTACYGPAPYTANELNTLEEQISQSDDLQETPETEESENL